MMLNLAYRVVASAFFLSAALAIVGCASSTEDPFVCGPSTCTGCCKGNTCVSPPDELACGGGGNACEPCRANEACSQGRCVPDNCAGCVNPASLACETGKANTACGEGGIFCASCGTGTVCKNGRCESDQCIGCKDGTGTCQPGTADTACGEGGAACAACTAPATCQDRKCLAPATCNATTCATGCCDDNDMCQTAQSITACGTGGARCAACSGAGATCMAGQCKQPCGPANCAGCCNAQGMCVASTNDACGNNGVACVDCAGSDICSNGQCVATACKSTCPGCCEGSTCQLGNTVQKCGKAGDACGACKGGQVCTSGACVVDPNSVWDFVATSGEVPLYDMNGSTWDSFGGLPDPYFELELAVGKPEYVTGYGDYVDNTITPDWTTKPKMGVVVANVKASVLLAGPTYVRVKDDDVGTDNSLGACTFTITQPMFNGVLWTMSCASAGVTWKVNYKIVPHT
jgi:hypothetical protein